MTLKVRPATPSDILELTPTLLPVSYEEFKGAGFDSPEEAIELALRVSKTAEAYLHKGKVVGLAGFLPDGGFWGVMGANIRPVYRELISYSRARLKELLNEFGRIHGATHENNEYVIRWVKLLGFTVSEPREINLPGIKYREFELCAFPPQPPA